uniref:NAD(P)H oxidase (H2O2-forming) n=1 Tax=Poecilia reticulata TaxID=8081 RepID=A0A3P9PLI5_POERE
MDRKLALTVLPRIPGRMRSRPTASMRKTRIMASSRPLTMKAVLCSELSWEVPRFDGWYNSLAHPERGAVGAHLVRLVPARYWDGVYQPVHEPVQPNARGLSRLLAGGASGLSSARNRTVLSLFFGYHVAFEIFDVRTPGCPPQFMNIKVPKGDPVFDPNATGNVRLPFQRGQWNKLSGQSPGNPRVNSVTAWIDGSSIYGPSSSWSDFLRSFSGGLLNRGSEWNMPNKGGGRNFMWSAPDPSTGEYGPQGLYELGNAWANENLFTAAEGIIWFRYHNYVAAKLHKKNPEWSDERLFQNARKTVVATLQNIALYEWLPGFLGDRKLPPYPGYQKFVDPGISPEFQAAAIRFGMTMAPPGVYMRNKTCHFRKITNIDGSKSPAMRLCNSFWKRQSANMKTSQDVDELLMGMASQIAEKEDHIVVEDLRDFMYGPLRFSRTDLVALTIQRGRDFGLQSYTETRRALDLPPLLRDVAELYGGDISKLELFPGGLLESTDGPGPVFSAIILDQFERVRNGDRFWFENKQNGLFTDEEIQTIRRLTYRDVLIAVTSAEETDLQENVFLWTEGDPCPQPAQLDASMLHPCTNVTNLDYFDGSHAGFGIAIIVMCLFPLVSFLVACLVACLRKYRYKKFQRRKGKAGNTTEEPTLGIAGRKSIENRRLQVLDGSGAVHRSLSLRNQNHLDIFLSSSHHHKSLLLKVPKEYDLVLFFDDESKRSEFVSHVRLELEDMRQEIRVKEMRERELLKEALTKEQRAQIVETFIRHAFSKVLEIEKCDAGDMSGISSKRAREVLQCELTASEFAEALGLKPDSLFVDSMFTLADKDGNGYLSFQEFLDVIVIFMKGSPEEKSQLMFSMNDIGGTGCLSKEEFARMLRSFIEISNGVLSKTQAEDGIKAMMQAAGFDDKEKISWRDFHSLLKDHEKELQFAQLNVKGLRKFGLKVTYRVTFKTLQSVFFVLFTIRKLFPPPTVYVKPNREQYIRNPVQQKVQQFKRFIENYRRHIVCFIVVFATGVPESTVMGIIVARGTAAGISFLYPYILLTVCRNLITLLRETFLNRYIPFDAAIDLHRIMAMTAIVLSVAHSLGHVVNIYMFSTSDLSILSCLFPNVVVNNGSEIPPKWYWWFFQTVPGITGVLLLFAFAFMYVFASHYFRRISFRGFWITHYLYVVVYILTVIHGSYALLQEPRFHVYLIPPSLLFLLDKLISLSRKKVEIPVLRAELLPSGVTHLEFKRPPGFVYRSGQWVRVACLVLGTDEYHPFTLTSAPHEENLSLHIRAVGPWTSRLRELYTEESLLEFGSYPKLYLDGPFGEGHQEWNDFEVSVLVGGGIGVTPFTSILKDLVFKSSIKSKILCKKVYFIWVTRTQRQFEWVSDIIREVEEMDTQELVSVHTYITQVAEKFDLRTTMLYVCERHFQKVWNRSLFTGLRSVTHFGRPPFVSFFSSLQEVHPEVGKIGVFSCGPPGLTKNVEKACQKMNKRDQAYFMHHYENF